MNDYLFSYGTLQQEDVQRRLFGRLLVGTRDVLPGYKLLPVKITDLAFLAKGESDTQLTLAVSACPADTVEGMVFDVSEDELCLADTYEPAAYERERVDLASGRLAWVYAIPEQS
jgi:hypothetical protein